MVLQLLLLPTQRHFQGVNPYWITADEFTNATSGIARWWMTTLMKPTNRSEQRDFCHAMVWYRYW